MSSQASSSQGGLSTAQNLADALWQVIHSLAYAHLNLDQADLIDCVGYGQHIHTERDGLIVENGALKADNERLREELSTLREQVATLTSQVCEPAMKDKMERGSGTWRSAQSLSLTRHVHRS